MAVVRRNDVARWVAGYERAWRTPGTAPLATLFASDVTYLPSPWASPVIGLDELALFWESERVGSDERFTLSSELVALDADVAVVRVQVEYEDEDESAGRWRNLWVLRFAAGGRCVQFEEWPFGPGDEDGHASGD